MITESSGVPVSIYAYTPDRQKSVNHGDPSFDLPLPLTVRGALGWFDLGGFLMGPNGKTWEPRTATSLATPGTGYTGQSEFIAEHPGFSAAPAHSPSAHPITTPPRIFDPPSLIDVIDKYCGEPESLPCPDPHLPPEFLPIRVETICHRLRIPRTPPSDLETSNCVNMVDYIRARICYLYDAGPHPDILAPVPEKEDIESITPEPTPEQRARLKKLFDRRRSSRTNRPVRSRLARIPAIFGD